MHEHLAATGATGRDDARYYVKAALIAVWFVASWVALVFFARTWWQGVGAGLSLGFAMAGIGFNLMHDGGHGACSRHAWVNRAMALTLEILGGSSFIWRWKHNVVHHTYSNIATIDDDLEVGPWARLAPHQPRRWYHRFQHLYMWLLFGLLPFKWYLIDIRNFRRGWFSRQRIPRAKRAERAIFIVGKLLLPLWALAVPMLWRPPLVVVAFYALSFFTLGVVLSVTFLLAHVVEQAQCGPLPPSGRIETEWAAHQVQTTVDFAPRNPILSWYLGGLNYQIEHHLFPHVSHVFYPAIAPLVQQACGEFGVRYSVQPSFRRAVAAHYAWLRRMGAPDQPA